MAGWSNNPIMEWSTDSGATWIRITDHGRAPLTVTPERIGNDQRMVNGGMRRHTVAKKRTWELSWSNLPSKFIFPNGTPAQKKQEFLANGDTPGEWLEEFYNGTDTRFLMRMRSGGDINATTLTRVADAKQSDNERLFTVMLTDMSKEVIKRGVNFDIWNFSLTLTEA